MPAPPEVMNIRQASQYLGISRDTLYRYVAEEKIPGFKLGNRWKFKKTTMDRWMEKQSLATRRRQMAREVAGKPEAAASVRDGSKRYAAARRLL